MEKDEILKKAQRENQGKDLADKQAIKDGTLFAYLFGVIALMIVDLINYLVLGYKNSGAEFVIFSMACTVFIVKYVKLRKRHELITAIIWGIFASMELTLWILQLCKAI